MAFNDIQSDYYQIPSEDKEKLKNVEEKIREDLKNTNIEDVGSNQDTANGTVKSDSSEEQNKEENSNNTNETKGNYREKLKNTYGLKNIEFKEVIKPGQVIFDSGS